MTENVFEIPDVPYQFHATLKLSGEHVVIGHNDDSVILDYQGEPIYMDITEAKMLVAALRVAIENVGV